MKTAILEILREKAGLSSKSLERVRALSESACIRGDVAALRLGLIEEAALARILADWLRLPMIEDTRQAVLDPIWSERLTPDYMRTRPVAAVIHDGGQLLLVAEPLDTDLIAELEFFLDEKPKIGIALPSTIRALVNRTASAEAHKEMSEQTERSDRSSSDQFDLDGPVIRFVNSVIQDAVARGASDIHFEPQEAGLCVRFRTHGVLASQPVDNALNASQVLARVKVLAGMNVAERRLPQDGRIGQVVGGRKIDFRVSTVPTSFGESAVLRVLDPSALRLGWENLGFDAETTDAIIELIERPNGMFLITGPTGSGKTTTLYSALAHINSPKRKVLTVEDPIEYDLTGITQVQVNEEIGLSFAQALRTFLRHDPDVIMIGEIRDQETAEIACRAALVGRLVLSTMHTSSPDQAYTRLIDLGVEEYIVRAVLLGALGQTLDIVDRGPRVLRTSLWDAAMDLNTHR